MSDLKTFISSPLSPSHHPCPSSEGLFFCMGWGEAVFRLVGDDSRGGWIFSLAEGESRRTGSCGARGGKGMREHRGGAWPVGIVRGHRGHLVRTWLSTNGSRAGHPVHGSRAW